MLTIPSESVSSIYQSKVLAEAQSALIPKRQSSHKYRHPQKSQKDTSVIPRTIQPTHAPPTRVAKPVRSNIRSRSRERTSRLIIPTLPARPSLLFTTRLPRRDRPLHTLTPRRVLKHAHDLTLRDRGGCPTSRRVCFAIAAREAGTTGR
jgi:hypothetical protein